MKNSVFLLFVIAIIFSFSGCKKEEANNQAGEISIYDVSSETEWDYWVVGEEGDNLFVNVNDNKPTSVFYTPDPEKDGYAVFFDEDGFPNTLVINDHIFLFSNFSGTKVDAALISPDGSVNIARDIETNIDWNKFSLKSASGWGDWFTWTGHALGGIACTVGIATGPATFGVSWVVTGIGCGATAVSVLASVAPDDFEVLGLPATLVGSVATAVGCAGTPDAACLAGLASAGSSFMASAEGLLAGSKANIRAALAALVNGYGDVQVSLTWDNTADLDLYVTDPFGETVSWDNLHSSSGGVLDADDNDGYGPENIYWPLYQAPQNGENYYHVNIHFYPHDDRVGYPNHTEFTLLVSAFGYTEKYEADLYVNEEAYICYFNDTGIYLGTGLVKSTSSISKSKE